MLLYLVTAKIVKQGKQSSGLEAMNLGDKKIFACKF